MRQIGGALDFTYLVPIMKRRSEINESGFDSAKSLFRELLEIQSAARISQVNVGAEGRRTPKQLDYTIACVCFVDRSSELF
jgi:hypothetical protein